MLVGLPRRASRAHVRKLLDLKEIITFHIGHLEFSAPSRFATFSEIFLFFLVKSTEKF